MSWTHERALVAAFSRDRKPDDPELQAARQRLKALRLEDHVKQAVASFPPLTPEQLDRVSAVLHPRPAAQHPHPTGGDGIPVAPHPRPTGGDSV
jgi:hypothetical protein